jgi:hypothetical protein
MMMGINLAQMMIKKREREREIGRESVRERENGPIYVLDYQLEQIVGFFET